MKHDKAKMINKVVYLRLRRWRLPRLLPLEAFPLPRLFESLEDFGDFEFCTEGLGETEELALVGGVPPAFATEPFLSKVCLSFLTSFTFFLVSLLGVAPFFFDFLDFFLGFDGDLLTERCGSGLCSSEVL